MEGDNGTEVVGLMRTKTSDNTDQAPLSPSKSPRLERHISSIPQNDNEEANAGAAETSKSKNPLKKLKDKITRNRSGDKDDEQDQTNTSSRNETHQTLSGLDMPAKLKRNISNIPTNDYDSETEQPEQPLGNAPEKDDRHDSGVSAGSDFEVAPMLRIASDEAKRPDVATKRPELERHISRVPENDDRGKHEGKVSTLERTISHIPQEDYDSDEPQ